MRKFVYIVFMIMSFGGYSQEVRIHLENCTLDERTLNEIQNSFNFQVQFYARIFNDHAVNSFKARIFGTQKDFQEYSKRKADFNPLRTHSIAFYDHDLKEMILHKEIDNFSKIFAHELSHAILHYYCENAQSWLHEGFAGLFEDIVLLDSAYYFDRTQVAKFREARAFLLENASVTEPIRSRNFYATHESTKNYALSWALILYLYKTNPKILSEIVHGHCNEDLNAFTDHYPGGIELLQIDIRSFFLNFNPHPK